MTETDVEEIGETLTTRLQPSTLKRNELDKTFTKLNFCLRWAALVISEAGVMYTCCLLLMFPVYHYCGALHRRPMPSTQVHAIADDKARAQYGFEWKSSVPDTHI